MGHPEALGRPAACIAWTDFCAILTKTRLIWLKSTIMHNTAPKGRVRGPQKKAVGLYLLVFCAGAALIGGFRAAVMGAAGDTIADRELGQIDFVHNGPNLVDAVGLAGPAGTALDKSVSPNRLYVADSANNRVLRWNSAEGFLIGAPADLVIGQISVFGADRFADCRLPTGSNLCQPAGIAVDHKGNLYVADTGYNRVLEYFAPVINHPTANVVFGLGSSNNNGGVNADSLSGPQGLAIDSNNNLYVADQSNNRVLEFDRTIETFTSASVVFGQNGIMSSNTPNLGGISANSLWQPAGVGVDNADNLYIADTRNNRVLEFDTPLTKGTTARLVFGQPDAVSGACNNGGIGAQSLCRPQGVTTDGLNRLYVEDVANNRILGFSNPLSGATTPILVIGQANSFSSVDCNQGGVSAHSLCFGPVSANLNLDNEQNLGSS
jgi:sugar lactone lactonase YvrE